MQNFVNSRNTQKFDNFNSVYGIDLKSFFGMDIQSAISNVPSFTLQSTDRSNQVIQGILENYEKYRTTCKDFEDFKRDWARITELILQVQISQITNKF